MQGSLRTLYDDDKKAIYEKIDKICKGISLAHNAEIEFELLITNNSKEETMTLRNSAGNIVGKNQVEFDFEHHLIGEDFSYFLQRTPGCFFIVGPSLPGKKVSHHSPEFDFDERALNIGASVFVQLIEDLLI